MCLAAIDRLTYPTLSTYCNTAIYFLDVSLAINVEQYVFKITFDNELMLFIA